jgi:uncharacterized membrane-anchored protein YitT (DUF2179 family)
LAISGLALVIATINYPVVTSDKLLVAAFGGFFLGAGIGLSIRGGGVIDGTEILAIYLSKKIGFTIGDIILVFNIIIFSVATYLLSIEVALYAILTYLAASKTDPNAFTVMSSLKDTKGGMIKKRPMTQQTETKNNR